MHRKVMKGHARGVAFTDSSKERQLEPQPEDANLVAIALGIWRAKFAAQQ